MTDTIRFTEDGWSDLQRGLWERSDVETAAVVLAEVHGTAENRTLAVRQVIAVPENAYRHRAPDRIELDPIWMNAQCREARRSGCAVLTVHTHLTDGRAGFSWADDAGDARLMPALSAQMPSVPHGSMNVTLTDAAARTLHDHRLCAARVVVVGKGLRVFPSEEAPAEDSRHARQELALGRAGQQRLRRLTVGVVGLGGTGSVVTELLCRLGVMSFVLMDGDGVEHSNLSRILGSTANDAARGTSKVGVAERHVRFSSTAAVEGLARPLQSDDDLAGLAGCDVVFSCVDRLAPRALLNRFAYAAKVPVIDMGSAFRVDAAGAVVSQGGKVAVVGPGHPCLWCWGDLDSERVRVELLTPEQRADEEAAGYVAGAEVAQPSVVTFNAMLAAAAATLFLQLVTAYSGLGGIGDRLNFDFVRGTSTRATVQSRPGCRFCGP